MTDAARPDGAALISAARATMKLSAEAVAALEPVLAKAAPEGTPPVKAVAGVTSRLIKAGEMGLALRLASAVATQLDDVWPLVTAGDAFARNAIANQTMAAARAVMKRRPQDSHGPRLALKAFLLRRQFDQAATLLDGLPAEISQTGWAERGRIAIGLQRNDAAAVQLAATRLMALEPNDADGPIALSQAHLLRKDAASAGAVIAAARARLTETPALLAAAATAFAARGETAEALGCYATIRAKFEQSALGFEGAVPLLLAAKDYKAAEKLAIDGHVKFPRNETILRLAADAARQAKRADRESHYWDLLASLRPTDPRVALNSVEALLRRHKNWDTNMDRAMLKLGALHAKFPNFAPAYIFRVKTLRLAQRLEEADAALAEACAALPGDIDLAIEQAAVLNDRGLTGNALFELRELRKRAPGIPRVEAAYIRTLSSAGQYDLAEAACQTSLAELPAASVLYVEYARVASLSGNWDLAASRLAEGLAKLPGDTLLLRQLERVQTYAQMPDPARDGLAAEGAAVLNYFETLGGTGTGCEFGLAHRRMGVDRLSLLRWAKMEPEQLIAALKNGFAGAGSETQTQLRVMRWSAISEEYWVSDAIYGMESHTFVRPDEIDFDKMLKQTCRRIKFLSARLMEDLREGGRIYVYKLRYALDFAVIEEIFRAFRQHGNNALLVVGLADDAHPAGSVTMAAPGLLLGYLASFMDSGPGGVKVEAWRAVCMAAAALWPPPAAQAIDATTGGETADGDTDANAGPV